MSSPPTSVLKGQTALPRDKVQQIGLLNAVNDKYGGVVVDMKEPMDSHIYVPLLRASISQWRQQGKKGVWIKLPIQQANLVEPTVKEGFRYHHAESNYLMLVYWIPDSPDTLPANASHIVGIGAFVMNNKREVLLLDSSIHIFMLFSELKVVVGHRKLLLVGCHNYSSLMLRSNYSMRKVLVVKEKHGYFKGKDAWKFPTGVVNQGEDICAAAIREVKEETGIDTEFMEILAFRLNLSPIDSKPAEETLFGMCNVLLFTLSQPGSPAHPHYQTHQQFLGKSDLFFVCMLQPLSFDITKQDSEIKAAQWIPIDEYVNQTYNREHKPFEYIAKICLTKSQSNYGGFSAVHTLTSSGKQPYLYFNGQDFKP
ncbi:hypothetical protein POTOM_018864 [Populus tomentosa]|uniref:Nudix hydrolase domain-containing protein n=1 Tax=Populus tomentosa TaxID=118781 RepID=A0A8X8A030_POPTO|nr:hypothetical protein POTOM_018864 [Populus tomentosa]